MYGGRSVEQRGLEELLEGEAHRILAAYQILHDVVQHGRLGCHVLFEVGREYLVALREVGGEGQTLTRLFQLQHRVEQLLIPGGRIIKTAK